MIEITVLTPNHELKLFPAKPAIEFEPGEVIMRDYGYTWKVIKVETLNDGTVMMRVEHVPEEVEFWNNEYEHTEMFAPATLLAIAERHGNEGLC